MCSTGTILYPNFMILKHLRRVFTALKLNRLQSRLIGQVHGVGFNLRNVPEFMACMRSPLHGQAERCERAKSQCSRRASRKVKHMHQGQIQSIIKSYRLCGQRKEKEVISLRHQPRELAKSTICGLQEKGCDISGMKKIDA